jgi:hypothetical protein
MNEVLLTQNLGFPRIGEQRELKRAVEAYWKGKLTRIFHSRSASAKKTARILA